MYTFIIDNAPNFCPGCGKDMSNNFRNQLSRNDFFAHAAHTCPVCGAHFQYVNTTTILRTAQEAGGDMVQQ